MYTLLLGGDDILEGETPPQSKRRFQLRTTLPDHADGISVVQHDGISVENHDADVFSPASPRDRRPNTLAIAEESRRDRETASRLCSAA